MAGMFELFIDAECFFRFRVTAPDGTVMVVSKAFESKPAAVAGIAAVREYAGMGHITDLSQAPRRPAPPEVHEVRRIPAADHPSHPRSVRPPASASRWA
ncbi:MAG: hypothetical protein JWQ75_3830 [Pseudarthrobacter sp.]|nr:hypothetical protein [Pseudarthrobacter sp.]